MPRRCCSAGSSAASSTARSRPTCTSWPTTTGSTATPTRQCGADGISYTELKKVYNAEYVEKNLGAALPGVTFTTERGNPELKTFRYLGCASNRAIANPDPGLTGLPAESTYVTVPDPQCVGKKSDRFQEGLEYAKSRGDTVVGGVNDVDRQHRGFPRLGGGNRAEIAPQPPGQFTSPTSRWCSPARMTWALPAIVGGIALGTPNNEGWGILNNLNDRVKGGLRDRLREEQALRARLQRRPGDRSGGSGFSYTIEHEASHFLGPAPPARLRRWRRTRRGSGPTTGRPLALPGLLDGPDDLPR